MSIMAVNIAAVEKGGGFCCRWFCLLWLFIRIHFRIQCIENCSHRVFAGYCSSGNSVYVCAFCCCKLFFKFCKPF